MAQPLGARRQRSRTKWPTGMRSGPIGVDVFPIGCVIYFPGVAILGRADPPGAPPIVGWLAPLAGPVFLTGCLQVWRIGIRYYRSTGSRG
jgi:hypothetical protein